MTDKLRVGLIGLGYWGPHYIRLLKNNPAADLVAVCDYNKERVHELLNKLDEKTVVCYSLAEMLTLPQLGRPLDALIVATPASTHYEICRTAAAHGLHVLCEKPVVTRVHEYMDLMSRFEDAKRVLLPGFTFLFNPVVREMRALIDSWGFKPRYATAIRTNWGPVRKDVTAAQDLAVHDISIFRYLFGPLDGPVQVIGTDREFQSIHASFGGVPTSIMVSWHEPSKRRNMRILTDDHMLEFEDGDPVTPLRLYSGPERQKVETFRPSGSEPLALQLDFFIQACKEGNTDPQPILDISHDVHIGSGLFSGQHFGPRPA